MEKMKVMFTGPAGRFGLGVAIGCLVTRIVDGNPIGSAIGIALVAGFISVVIHGMISNK